MSRTVRGILSAVRHTASIAELTGTASQRQLNCFWRYADMGDAKTVVDAKIAGKKVVVFSKSYCPYCTKAKRALDGLISEGVLKKEDYEVFEIENEPNCEEIQSYLLQLTQGRSVPRVFVKGEFIGGGDETVQMKANGKLKALLS